MNLTLCQLTCSWRYIVKEYKYLDDLEETTDEWFEPFTPIQEYQEGRKVFHRNWKEYGARPDWYGDTWHARIAKIIFVPGGFSLYGSRVAASIVVWFGSNNGRHFLQTVLEKTELVSGCNNTHNENLLLSAWAIENTRRFRTGRRLETILGKSSLSGGDFEIAESIMLLLASDEGRKLMADFFEDMKWEVTWKVPDHTIQGWRCGGD